MKMNAWVGMGKSSKKFVIELDKLATSETIAGTAPAGPVKVADLARSATTWLLQECKASRNTGRVRCQKWAEKLDEQVSPTFRCLSPTEAAAMA